MTLELTDYIGRFDWDDPDLTAKAIEHELIGDNSHRDLHEGATPYSIERSYLIWFMKNQKYGETHPKSKLRWHEHFMRFVKILFPAANGELPYIVNCWSMKRAETLEYVLANDLNFSNWIGSKSSGKTYDMTAFNLALMAIEPDYSVCYLAAPYKNAAGSTVWGDATARFYQMKKAHPDTFKQAHVIPSAGRIVFTEGHKKSGFIELRGLDQAGKFIGSKARNQNRGYFILNADEINLFPSQAFMKIISNCTSNENFLGFTGCNFKDKEGMDGRMCAPIGREYADLKPDEDQEWLSALSSVTLRFDGYLNPNVLANRNIYRIGLLTIKKFQQHIADYGVGSEEYWVQIRSFPISDANIMTVLKREDFRTGGAYDEFVFEMRDPVRVASCDPAFGGGDKCMIGGFEFGQAKIMGMEGDYEATTIFRPFIPLQELPVKPMMTATPYYIDWARKICQRNLNLIEGRLVDVDIQIALGALNFLQENNIPIRNFIYDSSMRGGITHAMATIVGAESNVVDFGYKPRGFIGNDGQDSAEKYVNRVTEMYFAFSQIVKSGQYRGANLTEAANVQFCRRRYEKRGRKNMLETKAKFKEGTAGRSPDDSDVVALGADIALQRGFKFKTGHRRVRDTKLGNVYDQLVKTTKQIWQSKGKRLT